MAEKELVLELDKDEPGQVCDVSRPELDVAKLRRPEATDEDLKPRPRP